MKIYIVVGTALKINLDGEGHDHSWWTVKAFHSQGDAEQHESICRIYLEKLNQRFDASLQLRIRAIDPSNYHEYGQASSKLATSIQNELTNYPPAHDPKLANHFSRKANYHIETVELE